MSFRVPLFLETSIWLFLKIPVSGKRVLHGKVCFGSMIRGMIRLVPQNMIRGMIRGHDSRQWNVPVVINSVYAVLGNTHMDVHVTIVDFFKMM